jgi:rod shape-determining protein MreC
MRKHTEKLSLTWFIRHPLVATCILLALTILLPYLRVGERLKLLTFLPLAHAVTEVNETPYEKLSPDQRRNLDLARANELVAALEAENTVLRQAIAQLDALGNEAGNLGELPLPPSVSAKVLYHGDASSWRHSMVINRGTEHGIRQGMPVTDGRTLVGVVFLAGKGHSSVQLITDPGFAASCIVLDPGNADVDPAARVRGILRGDGSARPHFPRLELEDVAIGSPVRAGMHVVTNDYSGRFPLGLHVGVVREVIPQAGFLQVRIEANLDLKTLEVVQVLLHERPALEDEALRLLRRRR